MKPEKITFFAVWLIFALTIYLFYRYSKMMGSIGQMLIALIPSLIFIFATILIFSRDHKRVKKGKEKAEFIQTREMNLTQELRHDVLTYLVPLIVILTPLAFKAEIQALNIVQAVIVFLALIYLKVMYWGRL